MRAITTFLLLGFFFLEGRQPVYAQTYEIEQLILDVEKLNQLNSILDEMYAGYKILTAGYNTVRDISKGNFNLHKVFLDALYAVNPSVRNYKRIPYIIQYQEFLVKEYKRAWAQFNNDPYITAREIRYLENVYSYLIKQSLRNLDELLLIVTATKLRMSDAERLHAIDRLYYDMQNKVMFLRVFNSSTRVLGMNRAKEQNDVKTLQRLYKIKM